MSCRSSSGSSASVSLARVSSGLTDTQVQAIFHRLKNEGEQRSAGAPGKMRRAMFLHSQRMIARQEPGLSTARLESLLARLDAARAEKYGGPTFHAMQNVQAEADIAGRRIDALHTQAASVRITDMPERMQAWADQARADRTVRAPQAWVTGPGQGFPPDAGSQYAAFRAAEDIHTAIERDSTLVPAGAWLSLSSSGPGGTFHQIEADGSGGYRLAANPQMKHGGHNDASQRGYNDRESLRDLPAGRQTVAYVAVQRNPFIAIEEPDGTQRMFRVVTTDRPGSKYPGRDWSIRRLGLEPVHSKPPGSTAPTATWKRIVGDRATRTYDDGYLCDDDRAARKAYAEENDGFPWWGHPEDRPQD